MATPTYITTGDQRWNPDLKRWEPIDSPLPNYHPQGGDPLEGPGAPISSDEARARLAAAARAFGGAAPAPELGTGGSPAGLWPPAPNPGFTGDPPGITSPGGQQQSRTEGAESEGEYAVDRLHELEQRRTRDTEPPGDGG
jgi:hypothetical protein